MKPFVFHLADPNLRVPNFHLETFETEDEAIRHGRALLDHNDRYQAVSVFLGEEVIAEFARAA